MVKIFNLAVTSFAKNKTQHIQTIKSSINEVEINKHYLITHSVEQSAGVESLVALKERHL